MTQRTVYVRAIVESTRGRCSLQSIEYMNCRSCSLPVRLATILDSPPRTVSVENGTPSCDLALCVPEAAQVRDDLLPTFPMSTPAIAVLPSKIAQVTPTDEYGPHLLNAIRITAVRYVITTVKSEIRTDCRLARLFLVTCGHRRASGVHDSFEHILPQQLWLGSGVPPYG